MQTRRLSSQLVAALLSAGMLALPPVAKADLIGTQQIASQASGHGAADIAHDRAMVEQFLARSDVRHRMEQMGVSAGLTQQRVAALSDSEVASLATRIQSMPAAGTLGFQETVIILLVAILVVIAI
ncbi:PA2779 family protein [Thiomonas sp. FB-6]|uniref:PA2779 family protein n=1 Tax=Thiomonas sp. FB-6 TaxID=1158291 RepID=UPI00037D8C0A|nr:PA2779 family protein [Thiomonas sp. FB-6]